MLKLPRHRHLVPYEMPLSVCDSISGLADMTDFWDVAGGQVRYSLVPKTNPHPVLRILNASLNPYGLRRLDND